MIDGRAARFWRMRPSQLRALTIEEQGELVGMYLVENEIETYYESEKARRIDKVERDAKNSK